MFCEFRPVSLLSRSGNLDHTESDFKKFLWVVGGRVNSGFTTLPYKKQPVNVISLGNTTGYLSYRGAWLTAVAPAALPETQVKGGQNRNHECRNLAKAFCANRREEFSGNLYLLWDVFLTRFCCVASLSDSQEASCNLPPEKGRCMAIIPRYYYNPRSHSCERFIYGGCQGNANNFETVDECKRSCMRKCIQQLFLEPEWALSQ